MYAQPRAFRSNRLYLCRYVYQQYTSNYFVSTYSDCPRCTLYCQPVVQMHCPLGRGKELRHTVHSSPGGITPLCRLKGGLARGMPLLFLSFPSMPRSIIRLLDSPHVSSTYLQGLSASPAGSRHAEVSPGSEWSRNGAEQGCRAAGDGEVLVAREFFRVGQANAVIPRYTTNNRIAVYFVCLCSARLTRHLKHHFVTN